MTEPISRSILTLWPGCLLCTAAGLANAQTPTPDPPVALADPIPQTIELGDVQVNLVEFVRAPETIDILTPAGTNNAYARIQYLKSPPDESGRLFFNDTRGVLYVTDEDASEPQVYLDLRTMDVGFFPYIFPHESGLMSFAFHPEFAQEDELGYGKFYTAYSANPNSEDADYIEEDGSLQESVVVEWTASDPTALEFEGTHREILRVGQFRPNHNIGNIGFNPYAIQATDDTDEESSPPDSGSDTEGEGDDGGEEDTEDVVNEILERDWGMLYISFGDGGGAHDSRDHGQDVATPLGAMLRIDPLETDPDSGQKYGIPADNPDIEDAIPELWAFGLRHPQHFSWDLEGKMFLLDIGQDHVEEVNLGVGGANYGWRLREGTFATAHGVETDDSLGSVYEVDIDEDEDLTYPVAQYDHDEGFAIGSGFVYRGEAVPDLVGKFVFTELVRGRVFYIETEPVESTEDDPPAEGEEMEEVLVPGDPATVYELDMLIEGEEGSLSEIAGMPNTTLSHLPYRTRVDLRISVDRHGEMYLLSKGDGWIRKLVPIDEPADESE